MKSIEYYCLNVDCPIQHLEPNEVGWERDAEVAVCPRCGEPMAEVY